MTEPLYVDTSLLRDVARCSTLAGLRHISGYTTNEDSAPLRAGSAFHRLAEVWLKGGTKVEALAAFAEDYLPWALGPGAVPTGDRLHPDNLTAILNAWLDSHPLAAFPFTVDPALVEIGFAFPLVPDGSIVFTGRMDGIVTGLDDRELYVLEHKSTGRIDTPWVEQWYTDPQVSGYIWAARQHVGRRVVGVYIDAVQFSRLPSDPTKRCTKHGVPYAECGFMHMESHLMPVTRTDEELAAWHKDALHLARRYHDMLTRFPALTDVPRLRTQGKWNGQCRFCGFRKWCQIGRPMRLVDSFMTYDPWKPYDYSQGAKGESGRKP